MKKAVYSFFICFLISVVKVFPAFGDEVVIPNPNGYPEPVPLSAAEESQLGKLMPRTMHLLASSTPENRKKVKIAIYGQSLSDGNNTWWKTLQDALKTAYPNADIEVNCLGIGGCSSDGLWYATMSDIITYYPDLVIFHVFGSHTYYETIVRFIRGCTTAEMLIQTDHFGGNAGSGDGCNWNFDLTDMSIWDNQMSFGYVKGYCDTYGLERDNRRQEWYDYLKANCYAPSAPGLLSDGTHFDAQGQYLVSALTARHFKYYEDDDHDPDRMVTVYTPDDFSIKNNVINLSIDGNRVDVITENGSGSDSLQTLIDGKKPSEFPGSYNSGRANSLRPGYTNAFGPSTCMQEETWTLNIDGSGNFTLSGSKTGDDGSGNINNRFESNSGRMVFDPAAIYPAWEPKTNLNNQTRIFTTKLYGKDSYTLPASQTGAGENPVTLVQGVPNGQHELTLTGAVDKIKEIRVYRPPFKLQLTTDRKEVKFTQAQDSTTLTVSSNTYWLVYDKVDWITVSATGNNPGGGLSDRQSVTISAVANTTGKPRTGSITLTGVGVEPLTIKVAQ